MSHHGISLIYQVVRENPGFRASMGVIVSRAAQQTVLCWGAVKGKDCIVPELDQWLKQWPDATWLPLSEQQAQLFDDAWAQRDHLELNPNPNQGHSYSRTVAH